MNRPEDNFLSIYINGAAKTIRIPIEDIKCIEFGKNFLICQDKEGVIHSYNYQAIEHFHYPSKMEIQRGANNL